MPIVIKASGADTHTHTYTHTHTNTHTYRHPHRNYFKKPGAPNCGQHAPGLKLF